MERENIREFEVVSLEGRDMVTIIINGKAYDTTAAIAKFFASDINKAVKRVKGKT